MNRANGLAHTQADEGQSNTVYDGFTLVVGTFKSPQIYTLNFKPTAKIIGSTLHKSPGGQLSVSHRSPAAAGHSWLALSPDHTHLYTTCWANPPSVASYRLEPSTKIPTLLNTQPVDSLSGYVVVTPSGKHLISVGGPSGEVFRLDPKDGRIGALVQTLPFRTAAERDDGKRDGVAHGSFGGLRWGAHSVDISPDGRSVYVADIGHNCIWSYTLNEDESEGGQEPLQLGTKHISPRSHDGPRHCWPHSGGRVLYCVQEHSSMVDAFAVGEDGVTLQHLSGETILPAGRSADAFWADEVRTSNLFFVSGGGDRETKHPKYLYASTRGLEKSTKGYVAAYELDAEGRISGPALDIYETRTSGGLANAVEPAPSTIYEKLGAGDEEKEEFMALTDSEEGWVVVLGFDGKRFREVAAVKLEGEKDEIVEAATAVWV